MGLFDIFKKKKDEVKPTEPTTVQPDTELEETPASESNSVKEEPATEVEVQKEETAATFKEVEPIEEDFKTVEPEVQPPVEEESEKTEEVKSDEAEYEQGLQKTRRSFRDKLNSFMANFRSVDEDFFDDLEDLLIQSDVGYNMALKISDALREEVKLQNAKSKNDVAKVIVDKMVEMYQQDNQNQDYRLNLDSARELNVILFVGVNGAGKTTTIGKLAAQLKQQGNKVLLAAADTFRAGAIEQLQSWGQRVGVNTVAKPAGSDPAAVVYEALQAAKNDDVDVLLVDTAGRLQNNTNLMNELEKIKRIITREIPDAPHEVLLVVDATTGQNALSQAKQFQAATDVSGIVLSKLDGSSQGGIVLAINNEMHIPVKLVGLGEKVHDLRNFDPEKYTTGLFSELLTGMDDA